jgi:uncharacterized protein YqeY
MIYLSKDIVLDITKDYGIGKKGKQMKLTEQINIDLKNAIINDDKESKKALRQIKSCYTEYKDKEADITDEIVIKICRKLIASEKRCIVMAKIPQSKLASLGKKVDEYIQSEINRLDSDLVSSSKYIQTIMNYIPKEPSDDEIKQWLSDNLDLDSYKNRMMAMKELKAQFPMCDGNKLKTILMNI